MTVTSETLVDEIYEAAAMPGRWVGVLDRLASVAGARGGIFFSLNTDRGFRWIGSRSLEEFGTSFVNEGWANRNPRGARLSPMRHAGFVTDNDLFTDEEMKQEPFYTDLLFRHGLSRGAGTLISVPNGDVLALTVEGSTPVAAEAVALLDEVRPHLARAALMAGRLQLERAGTAVGILQNLGLPAAVVYPNRRLLLANALFEQLDGPVHVGAFDRVTLAHTPSDNLLTAALESIVSRSSQGVRSIPVPAFDAQPPLVVHLLPITGSANDIFTGGLGVMIVTPVVLPRVPCADILDVLFDLTPAEARLAAFVGSAMSPRDASKRLGISEETARTTLKRVFSKVGVSRQSELSALLGTLFLR